MSPDSGYVATSATCAGFYPETAPAHIAFAALCCGRVAGSAGVASCPRAGSGQGFGLALLAAANPDIAFEGYDFNPEHVANRAAWSKRRNSPTSRSRKPASSKPPRAAATTIDDIVICTASWLDRPRIQDAIVAILRQRLRPGGFAYVSYNCMPGWAPLAPIRQVMVEVKRRNPGSTEHQLALALELIARLKQGNAAYFAINPAAAQHLDAMLKLDRVYLAHEYLDEHWDLFQFSDVAARMSEAKLSYVASATLPENLDQYAVPEELQPLLSQTDDPVLKEDDPRLRRQQALSARPVRARHRRTSRHEHRRALSRSASRSQCPAAA